MLLYRYLRRAVRRIDQRLLGDRLRTNLLRFQRSRHASALSNGTKHAISLAFENRSDELDALFNRYGSDKGSGGDSYGLPWSPHSYSAVYGLLFGHSRDSIRHVFECGIGSIDPTIASNMTSAGAPGASLRAWRDYFPNALIIGADIDAASLFREDRIRTYQVDQTSSESIRAMWRAVDIPAFDVILDDGLHTYDAGICLFENSIVHLKRGGLYIIEDVAPTDLMKFRAYFSETTYLAYYLMIDTPARAGHHGNGMVVVRNQGPAV